MFGIVLPGVKVLIRFIHVVNPRGNIYIVRIFDSSNSLEKGFLAVVASYFSRKCLLDHF